MKIIHIFLLLLFVPNISYAKVKVGVWKEVISPLSFEAGESCMGGYGLPLTNPRCGSDETHDYLSVRALYIEGGRNQQLSILVFDAVGVGDSIIREIREKVERLSKSLNTHNLIISATHTHAGLDLQNIWGGVGKEHRERIIEASARSIVNAQAFARRVNVFASQSYVPVSNRRGLSKVDDNVLTLFFNNRKTNQRIATLVNLSAHPTILDGQNNKYSNDYVSTLRSKIEQERGGMTIFINGVLGDAQFAAEERTIEKAEELGDLVAEIVIQSERDKKLVRGPLKVSTIPFSQRVTNSAIVQLESLGVLDIDLDSEKKISTSLKYVSWGKEVSLLTFPGEALTGLGLPIKNLMNGEFRFFLGLSNASYGYFIPSDEYGSIDGRNTEEMFCMDRMAADNILDVIKKHLDNRMANKTNP